MGKIIKLGYKMRYDDKEPTLVYIPEWHVDHEGGDYMGVFTTLKGALKAIQNRCECDRGGEAYDGYRAPCYHDTHYILAWTMSESGGEVEAIYDVLWSNDTRKFTAVERVDENPDA